MKTLKAKLKANRTAMGTGSGDKYWDSVVEIARRHYRRAEPTEEGNRPSLLLTALIGWLVFFGALCFTYALITP